MSSTERAFIPVRFAVLTVSDTRGLEDDKSGSLLVERIKEAGHELIDRKITPDEIQQIRDIVTVWSADSRIDAIITTGGTGFTGRDITPEALEPLFEKRMDGFSNVFHRISQDKIGTSTVQSRATAGLIRSARPGTSSAHSGPAWSATRSPMSAT